MQRLALFVSLAVLLVATHCRGQDFSLEDALDEGPTQKPVTPNKKPPQGDDDFDLEDALNPGKPAPPQPAPPQPKPGTHGNTGDFSDSDLYDGKLPPDNPTGGRASNPSAGGQGGSGSSEKAGGGQDMIAGIVSGVAALIGATVSGFIAYQKKKLCFKGSDQENVNMESQQGAHAEPPVQCTLLQKQ